MRSTVESIEEYYQIIVELVSTLDDDTEIWSGTKYETADGGFYCYVTRITFLRSPETDQVWALEVDGDEYSC
jgi:hypothetical protein